MWIVTKNGYTYKVCYTQQEAIEYAKRMGGLDKYMITFSPAD